MIKDEIKIFRKDKRVFSQIPNDILKDPNLSWSAKGVLCYLLSKPDNWTCSFTDIVKNGKREIDSLDLNKIDYKEKRKTIKTIFKTLVEAGYAKLEIRFDNQKRVKGSYYVIADYKKF
jgi:hypothetical protein